MSAAKKVVPFPGARTRRFDHELAFMPAALEIVETPPSPIGRAIAATLMLLFALAILWASVSKIDIIATAPGKILPTGRTKVIQPFEMGVVRAIQVQDGQHVRAGQVLIELDPTMDRADLGHVKADLTAAELDIARLMAALSNARDPLTVFHPPQDASPVMIATQRALLLDQVTGERAKLAALDRQAAEKQAEAVTAAATIAKVQAAVPLQQQRVDLRKYLYDRGLESKLVFLQEEQDLVASQKQLPVERSNLRAAEAALAAIKETRLQTMAEFRSTVTDDLAKAEAKAAGLGQDYLKAQERAKLQWLKAPVDGIVQQLAVHTVGGVVTPAQQLMVVVPDNQPLEIEAMVSNKDIGFIHVGQKADIKVDTFSYTLYGLLHGVVESVSPDSVTPEGSADSKISGAAAATGASAAAATAAAAGAPAYAARVSLDRTRMRIDQRMVNLSPGMAVTVEVKTGSRRIISYLLAPLMRYGHDSLRER